MEASPGTCTAPAIRARAAIANRLIVSRRRRRAGADVPAPAIATAAIPVALTAGSSHIQSTLAWSR